MFLFQIRNLELNLVYERSLHHLHLKLDAQHVYLNVSNYRVFTSYSEIVTAA